MTTELDKAMAVQMVWKAGPVLRAAVMLVKAGLSELDKGHGCFGADNVPEGYAYEGQGICGTATRMLLQSYLIVPSQHHDPEAGVFHGRRKSLRASANNRRVDLYELSGRGLSEAFVKRYDTAFQVAQGDWVDMASKGQLQKGRITA